MKFYSRNNRPETIPTHVGTKEVEVWGLEYSEKGEGRPVVKELKDRYEEAQAYLDAVLIDNILRRCTADDLSRLNQIEAKYGDISMAPTSYIEAMNMMENAKEEFSKLPEEIKEKWNFSPEQFIAELGTKEFAAKMNTNKKEEVKEVNEQE